MIGHTGLNGRFVVINREMVAEQLFPGKTVPAAQHDLHNGLIVRDVVRHADDAQVVGANLMHADLGRFTAFHEVTRLQIHTGLAQVPQPLRECLGTAHAFADDIRARPWVSFLISAMRSSSEVPRTLMTTSAPKYKKPPQAACACGDCQVASFRIFSFFDVENRWC